MLATRPCKRHVRWSRVCLVLVVISMAAAPFVPARAASPTGTGQSVANGWILFSTATGTCVSWLCGYNDAVGFDIWRSDPDGTNVSNLTNHPGGDRDARSSPDGSLIAFRSNRTGNEDLFVMDADGQNVRQLTSDPANEQWPSWSPDGRRIAYVSEARGSEDVFVMNSDGTRQRLVASFESIWGLNWSPNGRWIAFTNRTRGKNGWGPGNDEIYLIRPDGSGLRRLAPTRRFDEGYAAWAPGSRVLVFQRTADCESLEDYSDCRLDVWRVHLDGSHLKRLTDSGGYAGGATWSPDGTRIAYTSDDGDPGYGDVFVMDRDGSNQTRVLARPESSDWVEDWIPVKE